MEMDGVQFLRCVVSTSSTTFSGQKQGQQKQFCADAKELHILMVPGSSFACPGYVRLAYCVSYETIMNSLPKFKELAKKYF